MNIDWRVPLTWTRLIADNVVKESGQQAPREERREVTGEVSDLMTTALDELDDDQLYVLMSTFMCIRYNQTRRTRQQRRGMGRGAREVGPSKQ